MCEVGTALGIAPQLQTVLPLGRAPHVNSNARSPA